MSDTLAEEGREISDDNKRYDERTDRMTFEVQKGNTTLSSDREHDAHITRPRYRPLFHWACALFSKARSYVSRILQPLAFGRRFLYHLCRSPCIPWQIHELCVFASVSRHALRKQAGWAKLQEVRATAAKHWTERVWYCHNQCGMRSSKEGTETSKKGVGVSRTGRNGARNALRI
jgi:hypothetical protein